ncbi:thioredoxin domain-containing protein 11-like [Mytilus galloprovincialis]|uniref:thioredoxin domain-containing protein 11-like n=1 Tax=Mytilus galloprovincialis TaxID=29158 RepID=UPI003F7BD434
MRPIRGLKAVKCFGRWMARYSRICVCTMGLILSLLALLPSLRQATLTSPAKPPRRFFPAGSAVIDFPYGNMNPIVDLLQKEEILFVMYYAPWCAQSVSVREEYQKAAKYLIDKVKFVGVNCWWPEGSCRNTYKFLKYPELYVYHTNLDGFKFNGIPTADELVRFVEDILYPITLLHSVESINNFSALHDNVVIGNFDLSTPTPPGYKTYYISAMKMIEWNHLQPVKFSVVNKPLLSQLLGMNDTKQFVILNLNGSFIYPTQNNFTSDSIVKWINEHRYENLVKWISVPGHKSLQLSTLLNRGPVLLVFAPVNRLHTVDFYYLILRELVLQYRNCHNRTFIILLEGLLRRKREHAMNSLVLPKDCLPPLVNNLSCCVSLHRQKHICELCKRTFDYKVKDSCQFSPSEEDIPKRGFENYRTPSCLDSYQHYNVNEYRTLKCKQCDTLSSHSCTIRRSSDRYVNNLVNNFSRSKCKRLSFQKSVNLDSEQKIHSSDIDQDLVNKEFTGFKCRSNKTVNVVLLDKNKHQAFLDRLGTYVPKESNISVSVIIDKQNEVQHFLRQPFTKLNIANFVINFTRGDLPHHFRSEVTSGSCVSEVCVSDATSTTFNSIVMDEDKDVMMLVYSPWCGFCASFAHIYLSLARYFKAAKNIIFSRINGDNNDLPWQYTIDRYPTLLFFPAHRKAESVKYPETLPLTLPNLIKFVLHHTTHDLRMDTAVDVCTKSCIEKNLRRVSEAIVLNIKRRQLLQNHIEKLKLQYKTRQTSVRFKSGVKVLSIRLKKIDKQYKNAFILLKFLKSSQKILDKDKLKNVLESKNNIIIEKDLASSEVRYEVHDEL